MVYQSGGGGDPDTELGYTTIGSTEVGGSTSGRRITITVPAGGLTISHGYVYSKSANNATFSMAIYETNGTQVGSCSNSSAVMNNIAAWWEITWSTPIFLDAGTYYIQYHNTAAMSYFYDAGSGHAFGAETCGTLYTSSSTREATMTVANYAAH